MAETVANKNRRVRQGQLREQLSNGKHMEHVIEIANKIAELDNNLDAGDVNRLKIAAELKLKLIDKYLPGLKAVEHTGFLEVSDMTKEAIEKRIAELLASE